MLEIDFCLCVSATVIALPKKITKGEFCFDCLFIIFFLKLKCKFFEMMPCSFRKFIHSFIVY